MTKFGLNSRVGDEREILWASEDEAHEQWEREISSLHELDIPGTKIDAAGELLYSSAWL